MYNVSWRNPSIIANEETIVINTSKYAKDVMSKNKYDYVFNQRVFPITSITCKIIKFILVS